MQPSRTYDSMLRDILDTCCGRAVITIGWIRACRGTREECNPAAVLMLKRAPAKPATPIPCHALTLSAGPSAPSPHPLYAREEADPNQIPCGTDLGSEEHYITAESDLGIYPDGIVASAVIV